MRRSGWLAGTVGVGMLGLLAAQGPAQQPPGFVAATAPAGTPGAAPAGNEVDITAPYAITPQAGTWMICAHSYMGPYAPTLAVQLAEVIRNKHHVPAYIFNRGSEERRRLREQYERACRAAREQSIPLPRHRSIRIEEQCAVLIGGPGSGWDTDKDATAFLKKVRGWPLPELHLDGGLSPYDMKLIAKPIPGNNRELKAVPDGKPINPFETSFAIRNPTLPPPPRPQNTFDPSWKKLNADEDYSLLKCPKPWTLVVKEYFGPSRIVPGSGQTESNSFLDKIGLGSHQGGEALSAVGAQAHSLAEFLSKLGFKAYVLHTRQSSIVTVGAFDGLNDPEMGRTQDRLARFSFQDARTGQPVPIGLFQHPMPMKVPHP
jgi:hypothetical protein